MKYIHLSDTHLGYQHLGLEERKQDFFDSFNYVIDYAIEHNVDFIIHTGDFFHTSRPSNETIIEAISLLKKLKDKNIPIYVIPGNHDRGSGVRDKTALDILKEFGIYQLERDFATFEDINIFGIKYIQRSILKTFDMKSILEQLYESATKKEFNILMLHMEFYPFFNTDLLLENILPEGFDYVGIGHYHQAQQPFNINGSKVVYSGSTEYTQFNERDYSNKGFYLVELENKKDIQINFVNVPTRRFIVERFDDESLHQVIDKLKDSLIEEKKLPVLVLKGKTKQYLTRKDILSLIEEKKLNDKFLHISVDIERVGVDYEFKYAEDIEQNSKYIQEIVEKNITQPQIKEKVLQLLSVVPMFENIEELENYISENPHLFDL